MINTVLFDLDETLLDRTTSLKAFLSDQFHRHSDSLGSVDFELWEDCFLSLDQRGSVHKSIVYPAILAKFGGAVEAADMLLEEYRFRCSHFARGFDGMAQLLAALRDRGQSIGIVTNGEMDFQTKHIEALGLDRLVDAILISEREGLRKPDAALFLRAAERLGTVPEKCLFVGDNPVADILGAAATGMKTAWFGGALEWPADQPSNPGASINHLSDVLDLLEPCG